jgi:hypothetical protein
MWAGRWVSLGRNEYRIQLDRVSTGAETHQSWSQLITYSRGDRQTPPPPLYRQPNLSQLMPCPELMSGALTSSSSNTSVALMPPIKPAQDRDQEAADKKGRRRRVKERGASC